MSIKQTQIETAKAIDTFHTSNDIISIDTEVLTEEEKLVLDLKTIWPIIKSIFILVRPFIRLFKGSKATIIVDRFIAGVDIIIPAD